MRCGGGAGGGGEEPISPGIGDADLELLRFCAACAHKTVDGGLAGSNGFGVSLDVGREVDGGVDIGVGVLYPENGFLFGFFFSGEGLFALEMLPPPLCCRPGIGLAARLAGRKLSSRT